ncbi:MAG TPA: hypothetical protein VGP34_00915, partial [Pontimonas sp.]|nr:hypothetical protein [Pontimonas sp.]
LPASAAGLGLLLGWGGADGRAYLSESALWSGVVMVGITLAMVLVYGGVSLLLRSEDARAVWGPVLRRLPFTWSGNTSS